MALIKSISGFRGTIGGKTNDGLTPTMTGMFADIINKVYNYEEISSSFIN